MATSLQAQVIACQAESGLCVPVYMPYPDETSTDWGPNSSCLNSNQPEQLTNAGPQTPLTRPQCSEHAQQHPHIHFITYSRELESLPTYYPVDSLAG